MTDDDLSRALNARVGGDPGETFSSRAYRERWTGLTGLIVWLALDAFFRRECGERSHCREAWQRARDAALDDLERVRRAGW